MGQTRAECDWTCCLSLCHITGIQNHRVTTIKQTNRQRLCLGARVGAGSCENRPGGRPRAPCARGRPADEDALRMTAPCPEERAHSAQSGGRFPVTNLRSTDPIYSGQQEGSPSKKPRSGLRSTDKKTENAASPAKPALQKGYKVTGFRAGLSVWPGQGTGVSEPRCRFCANLPPGAAEWIYGTSSKHMLGAR